MVFIPRIGFHGGKDRIHTDKSRDVVHMAVSVVSSASAIEPDNLFNTEISSKGLLQLLSADPGIPLLDIAQQAFFSSEQNTFTVWINGPAFQNQVLRLAIPCRDRRLKTFHAV